MTDFVDYLINLCSYVYSSLSIMWGGEITTAQFDLAYAWILVVIAIAFIFIFSLIPMLFRWIFNMFGGFGKN